MHKCAKWSQIWPIVVNEAESRWPSTSFLAGVNEETLKSCGEGVAVKRGENAKLLYCLHATMCDAVSMKRVLLGVRIGLLVFEPQL